MLRMFYCGRKQGECNGSICASTLSGNYFGTMIRPSLAEVGSPGDNKFPTTWERSGNNWVEETCSS